MVALVGSLTTDSTCDYGWGFSGAKKITISNIDHVNTDTASHMSELNKPVLQIKKQNASFVHALWNDIFSYLMLRLSVPSKTIAKQMTNLMT